MTTMALGWGQRVLVNPADVAAVADGLVVNAAWAVGQMVTRPRASRLASAGMDLAGWMDTDRLTAAGLPGARLEVPGLTDSEAAELEAALKSGEVQGALQALLAARLTDAPETSAGRAREAVRLAMSGRSVVAAGYAEQLSEFFDDKISSLVGVLQGRVGRPGLAQVRAEAFSGRIVALLETLADMVAALSHPDHGGAEESEFLRRYRRQVRERHGKLEPPDFERRRRLPVADIYVPTAIDQELHPEQAVVQLDPEPTSLTIWDLAVQLNRTVLLGDPGGGKTTAANVLADFFASDADKKVPFLVTLRNYAAKDPPERSVAEHVEQTLATLYQCPAPVGLVERLLLTGRAVVIFDGLDELLDTSRRAEVSARVEQFCTAYPLTPVLVTSRAVGYDEARLDDEQFSCYRLGSFGEDEVRKYARKWFAIQEGLSAKEAEADATAFLAESASVPDLRANPLLLSLMCILYRGEGFLPRNRAEVYEQCATLLFRKWDMRRRIHQDLRAGHLVEPAIRHLAWWLFNRENPQAAVTERRLIEETAAFLHGREFESVAEAREAAREFVEFCRGRMWVLSDAGTTAAGEKLYAFTHRTFLEYFSAAYLAAATDSPEALAHQLAAHVENQGWNVVGELAIQIKDRNSDRGADRVYEALLAEDRLSSVSFLIRCLGSVQPSPGTLRKLTSAVIDYLIDSRMKTNTNLLWKLFTGAGGRDEVVADEMAKRISEIAGSGDTSIRSYGLRIILMVRFLRDVDHDFWLLWSTRQTRVYAAEILTQAKVDLPLRNMALHCGVINIADALTMPGEFSALMRERTPVLISRTLSGVLPPYPETLCAELPDNELNAASMTHIRVIGRYLLDSPGMPLVSIKRGSNEHTHDFFRHLRSTTGFPALDEVTCLGFAAVICVTEELRQGDNRRAFSSEPELSTDLAFLLYRYLVRRRTGAGKKLPDLPVPAKFKQIFLDWAEGRANFVKVLPEQR